MSSCLHLRYAVWCQTNSLISVDLSLHPHTTAVAAIGRAQNIAIGALVRPYLHVAWFVPQYLDYNVVEPLVQYNFNLEDLLLTYIQTDYSS